MMKEEKIFPEDRIFLNQIAQEICSLKDGENWFLSLGSSKRRVILRELSIMALQASFLPAEVEDVCLRQGVKKGSTPCVLLKYGRPKVQMAKVLSLPQAHDLEVFRLLIGLLSVADRRRRARCPRDCLHWWHRNLADKEIVARLLESGEI